MAARTRRKVVVPPHPELMGCVGTALMVQDRLEKRFRGIMERSGLMFDVPVSYLDIAEEGHRYASHIGFTETTAITGRYVSALKVHGCRPITSGFSKA